MEQNNIIVYANKTVLKVTGLNIKGLDTRELEKILMDRFQSVVRVIGVTGSSIDMDVYGVDPDCILKDEKGIIQTISTSEGITPTEVAHLVEAKKIVAIDYNKIPSKEEDCCARERWMTHDSDRGDSSHRR